MYTNQPLHSSHPAHLGFWRPRDPAEENPSVFELVAPVAPVDPAGFLGITLDFLTLLIGGPLCVLTSPLSPRLCCHEYNHFNILVYSGGVLVAILAVIYMCYCMFNSP